MGNPFSKEKEIKNIASSVSKEEEIKNIARAQLQELEATLSQHCLQNTTEQLHKDLDLLKNTTVDIAITGVSGAGKSSLVNALRGMTDNEEGAAEIGLMETTRDLKGYSNPLFPNVTFWDLPGIGTPQVKAAEYPEKFNFKEYDLFIIVSSERFTENDVLLAHEIKKLKKKFYYVRTKVDASLDSERRRQNFTEENTLEKIRRYCFDNLTEAGESNSRVFLISRWDLNMYDFPLLYKTLLDDLDDLKRHALIVSVPGFSSEILKKKKAAMDALIKKEIFLSCSKASIPVPGLPLVCDIALLEETMRHICEVFGLDKFSLHRLAHWAGMPFDELRSAIKSSPMASQITSDFVTELLKKSLVHGQQITQYVPDYLFKWNNRRGIELNFITVSIMLKSFLRDVMEDAEKLLRIYSPTPVNYQDTPLGAGGGASVQ